MFKRLALSNHHVKIILGKDKRSSLNGSSVKVLTIWPLDWLFKTLNSYSYAKSRVKPMKLETIHALFYLSWLPNLKVHVPPTNYHLF